MPSHASNMSSSFFFIKYSCPNSFHRRSLYTVYSILCTRSSASIYSKLQLAVCLIIRGINLLLPRRQCNYNWLCNVEGWRCLMNAGNTLIHYPLSSLKENSKICSMYFEYGSSLLPSIILTMSWIGNRFSSFYLYSCQGFFNNNYPYENTLAKWTPHYRYGHSILDRYNKCWH